jgi:ASC-1-like (ASCH) protein
MIPALITWPPYFERVVQGRKTVEIRTEQDRTFAEGDRLVLEEWDPQTRQFTGRDVIVEVTDVRRDSPWVPAGYAALSIRLEAPDHDQE